MTTEASNEGFAEAVGDYLEILAKHGIIENVNMIDPDDVITATEDLLGFFKQFQKEAA